jgi:hypothetical protein
MCASDNKFIFIYAIWRYKMTMLAKLNVKTVQRTAYKSPAEQRRTKLLAAIEEQMRVLDAAIEGKEYVLAVRKWKLNAEGERVRVDAAKRVRAWFFEQDAGVYVQCKYGARTLPIADKGNAVFVKDLKEVTAVLEAFYAACAAGEFDAALAEAAKRKSA